ncbi:alpha/beta fold hydrolase [uncultured Pluralibacter sp.]|uniref:alpha/beta hydrolase n=1 Tax=uncultured Pluralibacter sp. TaxID=1490864 RepID=UPI002634C7C3|nr:alpha/beta fold hydrolase [uncultured Pluralibacter sp.]
MITQNEIQFAGNRTGVLLIHGLTGTPSEMRDVARGLNNVGYTVHCVQLAGHCGDVDDLIATGWRDWYQSVIDAAERLRREVDHLFIGGLSMGAVLSLKYASDYPVDGVLVYGATFHIDGWVVPAISRIAAPLLLPLASWLRIGRRRMINEIEPYGIRNETLRRRIVKIMLSGDSAGAGLPGNPWASVSEMMLLSRNVRRNLWKVSAPCLILHAEDDDVAHHRNALLVRDNISGPAELTLLKNSYHMITIDNDRGELLSLSLKFIARHSHTAPVPAPAMNPQTAGGALL